MKTGLVIWIIALFVVAFGFIAFYYATRPLMQTESAKISVLTVTLPIRGQSNVIVQPLATQADQTMATIRELQQTSYARNRRIANYPVKELYVASKCDTGVRPRMYVQKHCTDKDF